jgi:hypothetical protein
MLQHTAPLHAQATSCPETDMPVLEHNSKLDLGTSSIWKCLSPLYKETTEDARCSPSPPPPPHLTAVCRLCPYRHIMETLKDMIGSHWWLKKPHETDAVLFFGPFRHEPSDKHLNVLGFHIFVSARALSLVFSYRVCSRSTLARAAKSST